MAVKMYLVLNLLEIESLIKNNDGLSTCKLQMQMFGFEKKLIEVSEEALYKHVLITMKVFCDGYVYIHYKNIILGNKHFCINIYSTLVQCCIIVIKTLYIHCRQGLGALIPFHCLFISFRFVKNRFRWKDLNIYRKLFHHYKQLVLNENKWKNNFGQDWRKKMKPLNFS